jgi:hypothetical protein
MNASLPFLCCLGEILLLEEISGNDLVIVTGIASGGTNVEMYSKYILWYSQHTLFGERRRIYCDEMFNNAYKEVKVSSQLIIVAK